MLFVGSRDGALPVSSVRDLATPAETRLLSVASDDALRIMKGVGGDIEIDDLSHGVREIVTRLAA